NDPKRTFTLSSATGCDLTSPKAQGGCAWCFIYGSGDTAKICGAHTVVFPRFFYIWFAAVTFTSLLAYKVPAGGQESAHPICNEDAMIAFDASGSMSGRYASANMVRRIEKMRSALAKVLPNITRFRRVGLITFGPGRSNQCNNIKLQLKPTPNAANLILGIVN